MAGTRHPGASMGRTPFWPLLRFEVVANMAGLMQLPAFGVFVLMPGSESEYWAMDATPLILWPMMTLFMTWAVYAPPTLGRATGPDHREFLLTRPVGRRKHYWVKTAAFGVFVAVLLAVHLWPAVGAGDRTITCTWREHGRYVAGLGGSSVHSDGERGLAWAQLHDGDVQVRIPGGSLRVADFEDWLLVCITLVAQTVTVLLGTWPRRRWLPLGVAVLVPASLMEFGSSGYQLLIGIEEWLLFAFDRRPAVFWLCVLAFGAAVQWFNAKRFAQMEVA
jgi:hypothetical protein